MKIMSKNKTITQRINIAIISLAEKNHRPKKNHPDLPKGLLSSYSLKGDKKIETDVMMKIPPDYLLNS